MSPVPCPANAHCLGMTGLHTSKRPERLVESRHLSGYQFKTWIRNLTGKLTFLKKKRKEKQVLGIKKLNK
jgi:hypothetical protein